MFFSRKSRGRAHRNTPNRASEGTVQVLEDRRMLAGNALVSKDSSGNLTISGDALANAVEVTVLDGNVIVRGLQTTTINGGTANFTVATGTTNISGNVSIDLQNGNDTVLFSRNVLIRGFTTVSVGQGNDNVGTTRAQFQGGASIDTGTGADRVSLKSLDAAGDVTVSTGTGDDVVNLEDATFGGSLYVHTGAGADAISATRVTTAEDTTTTLFTGRDNDDVSIRNSTFEGVLKIWTKRGSDVVMLDDNTFGSTVGVNLGRDSDTLLARATNTFNGAFRVLAGHGSGDNVEVDPANVFNGERRVRKNEGNTANTNTISTRVDNATTGVIAKGTAAGNFFTGLLSITPRTLTIDNTGNTTTSSVGNVLITRNSNFIVAGTTTPLAVVTLDTDGDGSFDDGTVTADTNGNFSTNITLTRRDLDTTDTSNNDQRNGLNVIAVRSTDEANAVQNTTINVDLVLNTVVRFASNLGTYEVELFDTVTPRTVANFMSYFSDYTNSIIHRSATITPSGSTTPVPFVIQGGGFTLQNGVINDVVSKGNIQNEFSNTTSNVRGTLAMAQGNDINSGNSQWFVNLRDNAQLDNVPHTVFGRVIGNGMTVVDAIAALSEFNLVSATGVSALNEVPLRNTFTPLGKPLTGTVSTTNGSRTVTGVGTRFTTELTSSLGNPGGSRSRISINGQRFEVESIASDTQLTVVAAPTTNNSAVTARTDAITDADFVRFTSITEILDQV